MQISSSMLQVENTAKNLNELGRKLQKSVNVFKDRDKVTS